MADSEADHIAAALDIAVQYGGNDGAHRKEGRMSIDELQSYTDTISRKLTKLTGAKASRRRVTIGELISKYGVATTQFVGPSGSRFRPVLASDFGPAERDRLTESFAQRIKAYKLTVFAKMPKPDGVVIAESRGRGIPVRGIMQYNLYVGDSAIRFDIIGGPA